VTADVDGYMILRNVISVKKREIQYALQKVRQSATPIFNSAMNDYRRKQVSISEGLPYVHQLTYLTHKMFPHLFLQDPVLILSDKGCLEQTPHCDYDPSTFSGHDQSGSVPYGAILALQDETRFVVWAGSHLCARATTSRILSKCEKRILLLNKGDVLFFRGDLIHAGASYTEENIRLHAYLDHHAVTRHPDRTYPRYST
jgi:hypothetical protein